MSVCCRDLVASRRGQFYIISCITILMALLAMDSMIREHRPLSREDFSLGPLLFFQNSRIQGLKVVDASCTQASPEDTMCQDVMRRNLQDYVFFMKRTANELGFAWDGEISYSTDTSWDPLPKPPAGVEAEVDLMLYEYRIPIEVEANYDLPVTTTVEAMVLLPMKTDFDVTLWLVRADGKWKLDSPQLILCNDESGNPVTPAYPTPPSTCKKWEFWRAQLSWEVEDLTAFHSRRYYLYFNTTGGYGS